MGNELSFITGGILFFVSLLVMKAYWPGSERTRASWLLGLAIFLAFTSDALNTLWWQVGAYINTSWLGNDFESFRTVGLYLDVLFKGTTAFAGVLHLQALKRSIPEEDQSNWSWWQMPGYPRKCRIFTGTRRNKDGKNT